MNAQTAAKAFLGAVLFIAFSLPASAQKKPSIAEAKVQMARAQHIIDSVMKIAAPQMAAAKSTAASMGNYGSRGASNGVNQPKMPDFKKLQKDMDSSMANIQKHTAESHAARDAGLPKKSSASFSTLPNADRASMLALATAMLPPVISKLHSYDPLLQQALDTLIKNDTEYTPHAQGMLMLAAGAPGSVAQYMICRSIQLDPDNPWAINDLGVVLRGAGRNKDAAQCFRYAYSFNDTFLIIKGNLAWAVAYMGDFITAKKYFHEILDILPNYNSAWEGLGMIAYQEGDIATLFQCLSKQIKTVGAGGDGPSEEFTGFVDGIVQDEKVGKLGKSSAGGNKTSDNTFDNGNGEEGGNQDEPPTAYVEPPNYPGLMGGMFPNDIDHIVPTMTGIPSGLNTIDKYLAESKARVTAARAELPPISPPPYKDDQGMTITPASSRKYFSLFSWVHSEFEDRKAEVYKGFDEEEQKLIMGILANNRSFTDGYTSRGQQCGAITDQDAREQCMHSLNCEYKQKARGQMGTNLGAVSELWTKYNKKLMAQLDWYVAASTPYIKRVHNVKWNAYMNAVRQDDIRSAVLHSLQRWVPLLGPVPDGMQLGLMAMELECTTEVREIAATGPDPHGVKVKKLKTAPDYCDPKENVSFSKGPLVLESTCEHTAIGISFGKSIEGDKKLGPLKGSYELGGKLGVALEHVISQRHKEDNYNNVMTTIEVGGELKGKGKVGMDKGPMHVSAEGQVKAEATAVLKAGWRFDDEGNYLGRVKSADLALGVSASGSIKGSVDNVGEKSVSGKWGLGAEYHGEVFAASGSGYKVTKSTGGVTH